MSKEELFLLDLSSFILRAIAAAITSAECNETVSTADAVAFTMDSK